VIAGGVLATVQHVVVTAEAMYWIGVGLLLAPLPAGALAWYHWARMTRNRTVLVVLVLVSMSYLLEVLDLVSKVFVGPDYSHRRILTIESNLALGLLMLVVSVLPTHPQRWSLFFFGLFVALGWLQLGMVASVV